jgi:hypothetical protein
MSPILEEHGIKEPPAFDESAPADPDRTAPATARLGGIILPSGSVSISESAREIFTRLAPSHTLFWRGGALVEPAEVDGVASLVLVKPEAFRSRVERFGQVLAWRSGANGEPVLKPSKMSRDDAAAVLASLEARELLPPVASVLRCPVLIEATPGKVQVLGEGYHAELGGMLIVSGGPPPRMPVDKAAEALRWLVDEFDFPSPGDHSRALAAFITPALRLGGFIRGPVPRPTQAKLARVIANTSLRHSMGRAPIS